MDAARAAILRLCATRASIDFFERRGIPFVVGVNCFDGVQAYAVADIRRALHVTDTTPVLLRDVRERESCKEVLLEHVLALMGEPAR